MSNRILCSHMYILFPAMCSFCFVNLHLHISNRFFSRNGFEFVLPIFLIAAIFRTRMLKASLHPFYERSPVPPRLMTPINGPLDGSRDSPPTRACNINVFCTNVLYRDGNTNQLAIGNRTCKTCLLHLLRRETKIMMCG